MLHKLRAFIVMVCLLFALVIGVATAQIISAGVATPDLNGSTLSVDRTSAIAGSTLEYTVVISNSGGSAANGVLITDTLPAELTYQPGTFVSNTVSATTLDYGDSGNVITWTGNVDSLGSVTLSYTTNITNSVMTNDSITNTVQITGTGTLIERTAVTTIVDSFDLIFPIILAPVPPPVLNPIPGPTASSNSWTLTWNEPAPVVTGYLVQESKTSDFVNPLQYDADNNTFKTFSYAASTNNNYCYRVRAQAGLQLSDWSNVQCTVGNYYDNFSNAGSGWAIRQQDTDDTENSSYYQNGEFIVKIGGRWDYALASPLAQAPKPPYAIETRLKFDPTVDNLHAYGIVFGGNWNGQPCTNGFSANCFTEYYRFLVIWYGPPNSYRIQLKRIDYNDPQDNVGRGVTLADFTDIYVGDSTGFNTWRVEVNGNGVIKIFLNGNQVLSATDGNYINNPYFGMMASSDEYLGTEIHLDWYQVEKR